MPSKKTNAAKKAVSTILSLEKKVVKIKQQLIKAHTNKVGKLGKAVSILQTKLKQSKNKLSVLPAKKTASTEKKKKELKLKITHLNTDLTTTKEELAQAKIALKHAIEIEKAVNITKKTIGKTVIKKKKIKKIIKKAKILTPDLSKPITHNPKKPLSTKRKKPTKNWQPEKKSALRKAKIPTPTKTSNEQKKQIEIATNQEVKPPLSVIPVATPIKQSSSAASEQNKNDPNESNISLKALNNEISPTQDIENDLTPADEKPDKTLELKSEDSKQETKKPTRNWHTMPILRKNDD